MGKQPGESMIEAARVAMHDWKTPASLQLAQFAIESAWGAKVTGPRNYWGMKAIGTQPFVMCPTHEVYKGVRVLVQQPFRSFASDAESFAAHAKLLATGVPYADFRALLPDVLKAVYQLGGGTPARPRYATASALAYGNALSAVIRGSNLLRYDK